LFNFISNQIKNLLQLYRTKKLFFRKIIIRKLEMQESFEQEFITRIIKTITVLLQELLEQEFTTRIITTRIF